MWARVGISIGIKVSLPSFVAPPLLEGVGGRPNDGLSRILAVLRYLLDLLRQGQQEGKMALYRRESGLRPFSVGILIFLSMRKLFDRA